MYTTLVQFLTCDNNAPAKNAVINNLWNGVIVCVPFYLLQKTIKRDKSKQSLLLANGAY